MDIFVQRRVLKCDWLQLGVSGDGRVELYRFIVPRYTSAGVDLSQALAYILFELPDGTQGMVPILDADKVTEEETVYLHWLVGQEITAQPGRIRIALKFSGLDGEAWHSEVADCVVAETINVPSPQPVSLFSARAKARIAIPNNEPPITVSERTLNIPAELQNIAVQNDQNSETVTIVCPRYFDGHDLSIYSFFLRTENSEGGYDPVSLLPETIGNELHMEWTLRPPQTSYSGRLLIQLWVTGENFDWQTAEASVNIIRQIDGEPVIPLTPGIMDDFLKQISYIAESAKASKVEAANSAAAAKASEAVVAENAHNAATSAANAKISENNAEHYQNAAASSQTAAASSAAAASTSQSRAAESALKAEAAQNAIENMQVSAKTLFPGSNASVDKTIEGGLVHLTLGIPRGQRGETGPQGAVGPKGEQGIQGPEGPRGIDGVAVSAEGIYAFNVNESGHLILSYTSDAAPDFAINTDGHLILTL